MRIVAGMLRSDFGVWYNMDFVKRMYVNRFDDTFSVTVEEGEDFHEVSHSYNSSADAQRALDDLLEPGGAKKLRPSQGEFHEDRN